MRRAFASAQYVTFKDWRGVGRHDNKRWRHFVRRFVSGGPARCGRVIDGREAVAIVVTTRLSVSRIVLVAPAGAAQRRSPRRPPVRFDQRADVVEAGGEPRLEQPCDEGVEDPQRTHQFEMLLLPQHRRARTRCCEGVAQPAAHAATVEVHLADAGPPHTR